MFLSEMLQNPIELHHVADANYCTNLGYCNTSDRIIYYTFVPAVGQPGPIGIYLTQLTSHEFIVQSSSLAPQIFEPQIFKLNLQSLTRHIGVAASPPFTISNAEGDSLSSA